jgi:hypothetical protein
MKPSDLYNEVNPFANVGCGRSPLKLSYRKEHCFIDVARHIIKGVTTSVLQEPNVNNNNTYCRVDFIILGIHVLMVDALGDLS